MAGEQPAHDALGACEPKGSDAHSSGWWPKLLKSPNELDQTPGKLGWPSWTDNACYSIPVVGEPVFCSLSLGREAPSSTPPPPPPQQSLLLSIQDGDAQTAQACCTKEMHFPEPLGDVCWAGLLDPYCSGGNPWPLLRKPIFYFKSL